jgi:hypothetical protein
LAIQIWRLQFFASKIRHLKFCTVDSLVYASPNYASLMKLSYLCEFFPVPRKRKPSKMPLSVMRALRNSLIYANFFRSLQSHIRESRLYLEISYAQLLAPKILASNIQNLISVCWGQKLNLVCRGKNDLCFSGTKTDLEQIKPPIRVHTANWNWKQNSKNLFVKFRQIFVHN